MSVKVTYFNSRGLTEVIRLLLKYGGIDFEDVRIEREDWPKLKESTPFGVLPTYEENGKIASQSVAIARYVAQKVKLVGDNDWEDLEIDAVVDTIRDLTTKMSPMNSQKDDEAKEIFKKTMIAETIPYFLDRFEKIAKENNGHLAVGKLTWADFYFAALYQSLNFGLGIDLLENRPSLQKVRDNVFEIPVIKKWIEIRPKSDY